MTRLLDLSFGPGSRNRLAETTSPGLDGALAALESFYYAFNHRDLDAFAQVWTKDPLAQLNNPLGGILRGGEPITELYDRVFHGPARVTVTFGDIVEYADDRHAVFAGRETGEYSVGGSPAVPLSIRTSRYFRYDDGRWSQFHHHGSIDDPAALAAYQSAIRGS
ncbi:nuclear transport factor 2 family protein [Amycolatopsis cynarae]|uniref:Nuclear transport factor 2 family protein n=2 Tax=Amycolatopsis TaxID=1813 RepID=A0A558CZN5_9PSEU|nr:MULTISPECIES: nuclear transport factor 2 family protein [Amycolatopsis]TVT54205.1 nuclear transport factor 2 family protein [Amycolatopsis rhizosphaerae]WAL63064.1 nuclear transport factor 2 family protein [Amycolatopsis sp. HUAS 11-8]